jgi:hypothetical protein
MKKKLLENFAIIDSKVKMGSKQSRQNKNDNKKKGDSKKKGDMDCEQVWAQHGHGQQNLKMNVKLVPISCDKSRPVAILL